MKVENTGRTSTPAIAVVFSGGATLGSFEAGVIDSIARARLRPALLVGTSIGALNAAFWAFNPSPDVGAALHAAWHSSQDANIFPRSPISMLLQLAEDRPLGDPSHLRRFLSSILGEDRSIEDAHIPLVIVATDVVSGNPVVMRRGRLLQSLMASAAIPGLYPPVEIGGRLLVDGSLVANADIEVVAAGPIKDVVLIDLMAPASRDELKGVRAVLEQAITIALARQTELERVAVARRLRLVTIRLHVPHRPDLWDLRSGERLFDMGRKAGHRLLESHLENGKIRPGLIEPAGAVQTAG
ncbi:MAG TPA: patatin-like phospholipase family protein [Candidatus Dormibacteraeota bacterium]|nr:patatin-like phospholipase family protein [Candidatus Dormibacteraeota bacterium]